MAGNRARRRLSRGLTLLCLAAAAGASGRDGELADPHAADADLLEFLAEWEGADPAWLDTMMEIETGAGPQAGPAPDEEAVEYED